MDSCNVHINMDDHFDGGDYILGLLADESLTLEKLAEAEHRQFLQVTDNETDKFIETNKAKTTVYKTRSDLRIFQQWMETEQDDRCIEDIPSVELDRLLARFFLGKCER